MKSIINLPLKALSNLGETAIAVIIKGFKDFIEYLVLTFKLIWEKSVTIRVKVGNAAKYLLFFIASPFVKMWINNQNMRKKLSEKRREEGFAGAAKAFFPYLGGFIFGKRGLAVTLFNYAAPVLSFIFFMNVVSYATSANYTLKLIVNGEFLGYIENEQVFIDAEASVQKRVNYVGSDKTIEMVPEFAIANIGNVETLSKDQVSTMILKRADFKLVYAYGFFIDDTFYGAIHEDERHLVSEALESLLDRYRTGVAGSDEEVGFFNNVSVDENELFLEESLVNPQDIISMITTTRSDGEPYLPITITKTVQYEEETEFEVVYESDDNFFEDTVRTAQEGIPGINLVTAKVSYLNDTQISSSVIDKSVISESTPMIIKRGTKSKDDRIVSDQEGQYGKFIWPVTNMDGTATVGEVSQGYHGGHTAYDIANKGAVLGVPIVAGDGGVVVVSTNKGGGYGNYIIIQHEDGLQTLYAHCTELIAVEGQTVAQGEQIATLGTTGKSTGPHLHFEVRDGNRRLNPGYYLP